MLQDILAMTQASALAGLIERSRYISMAIQTLHVLGFTFLLGSLVAFNLRMNGLRLGGTPAEFVRSLLPLYYAGLTLAVVAGALLFVPRAMAYGMNVALQYKLLMLCPAVVLQFFLLRAVQHVSDRIPPIVRGAAAATLALWFFVGAAGRAIGFVA